MKKAMTALILVFLSALCVAEEPTDKYLVQAQKLLYAFMEGEIGMMDSFTKLYEIELAAKNDTALTSEQKDYVSKVLRMNQEVIRTLKLGSTPSYVTPAPQPEEKANENENNDTANDNTAKEVKLPEPSRGLTEKPKEEPVDLSQIKIVSAKPERASPKAGEPTTGFIKKPRLCAVEYTVQNKNKYPVYAVRVTITLTLINGMKEQISRYVTGGKSPNQIKNVINPEMTKTDKFRWKSYEKHVVSYELEVTSAAKYNR